MRVHIMDYIRHLRTEKNVSLHMERNCQSDLMQFAQFLGDAGPPARSASMSLPPLTDAVRKVFAAVHGQAKHLDVNLAESGCSPGRLSGLLTTLELKGLIRQLPGTYFVQDEGAGRQAPLLPLLGRKRSSTTMKSLVIVGSPAWARAIGTYLGKDYTAKASVGHIMDLPKSKLGVDIEKDFEPTHIQIKGKAKVINDLKSAAKKADRVLIAPAPDREDEAIAAHAAEAVSKSIAADAVYRVLFNEITKKAILQAVEHPGRVDGNTVDAQQARRVLDRLVGYQNSPLLEGQTPPRHSEALLVKMLEEKDVGRPRTYAAIISTIQDRDYVEKPENKFRSTKLEELVNTLLIRHISNVLDAVFMARMESERDKIEEGEMKWVAAARDFNDLSPGTSNGSRLR